VFGSAEAPQCLGAKAKAKTDQKQIKINGSGQECPLHTDGDLILNGGGAA
jgi:hypothetical protein